MCGEFGFSTLHQHFGLKISDLTTGDDLVETDCVIHGYVSAVLLFLIIVVLWQRP
jgi:hypothetical protein